MAVQTVKENQINSASKGSSCQEVKLQDLYGRSSGHDMGMSTVGFRSKKFNQAEANEAMYARFRQALSDLENAENVIKTTSQTITKNDILARQAQINSTNHLKDRVGDIKLWKGELEDELKAISLEINTLLAIKKRLEKALLAYEIIETINHDNINSRGQRDGFEQIQDDVELGLLKEKEIISSGLELVKRTLRQVSDQLRRIKSAKLELEMDWSDKKEALDIDNDNVLLNDDSPCKKFYPGAAKFQEIQSTPESWAQFSQDNLARAERERMASMQLRFFIDNMLNTISNDIIQQGNLVNTSYNQKISKLFENLWKLKEDLKNINNMIHAGEKNIENLRKSMLRKEITMKVAQTRLRKREDRPNVELTRDPAQFSLISEVNELARATDVLIQKTNESENSIKDLMDRRMAIEKNLAVLEYSIFIEKEKAVPLRTSYPSKMQLLGYD